MRLSDVLEQNDTLEINPAKGIRLSEAVSEEKTEAEFYFRNVRSTDREATKEELKEMAISEKIKQYKEAPYDIYTGVSPTEEAVGQGFLPYGKTEIEREALKRLHPVANAVGQVAGLVTIGGALKFVAPAITTAKSLAALPTIVRIVAGRMAQSGATFGLKEISDNTAEFLSGDKKEFQTVIGDTLTATGFGAGLGGVGSIASPVARIPAEAAYGFVTSKIAGSDNFEAGVNAGMFAVFGLFNTKNLSVAYKKSAYAGAKQALIERMIEKGVAPERADLVATRYFNWAVNRAGGFEKTKIEDFDKFSQAMRKGWKAYIEPEMKPEITTETPASGESKPITPEQKVIEALKEAKDVRAEQETLYSKARAQKFAKMQAVGGKVKGEKGFYAELGSLKGELPKVEFEAIRDKLTQEDIDSLFIKVKDSPAIGEWEKLSAREGLAKIFGEYGGKVPTENELALLNQVFGNEFTEAILGKRTLLQKLGYGTKQVLNIPRSIMSSFDFSAPFRQGVFLIGKPKQFWPAFGKMFKQFGSKKFYELSIEQIREHPNFELARESKLALTNTNVLPGGREEMFMSNWAEKIPFIGKGVEASGRAYTGFLNKLRFDVFNDLVVKAEKLGLDPMKNRDLTVKIAEFINNATGRGKLPKSLERAAVGLNSILFSPRLAISRLNLLNPIYYIKQDPFVRKEALKSLFTFAGIGLAILTLAKMAGADVGADPRSSDFGKIKIGDTRIDIWGGFQQPVRMAAQLITGKYISSTTGKEMTLGEGYKALTRWDILARFIENKASPVASFVIGLMKGQNAVGEEMNIPAEVAQRFTPMVLQDLYELMQEEPELFPAGLLGFFGVGIQTYKGKEGGWK